MTSPTDLLTHHPLHDGLAYAERGDRSLLGTLGHWHRGEGSKRTWVRGSQEDCAAAYVEQYVTDDPGDRPPFDSDPMPTDLPDNVIRILRPEGLLGAQGHDHHINKGPVVPYDLGHQVHVGEVRDEAEFPEIVEATPYSMNLLAEEPDAMKGSHPVGAELVLDEATEMVSFGSGPVSTKPIRGGKRSCVTTFADGEAYCGHSESRHNASGSCRSCDCTTFRVEA